MCRQPFQPVRSYSKQLRFLRSDSCWRFSCVSDSELENLLHTPWKQTAVTLCIAITDFTQGKLSLRPAFIYTALSMRIHRPWRAFTSATTLFFCFAGLQHVGPGMINRSGESIQMLILSDWNIPRRAVKNPETTLAASYWQPLSWALINMVMMCEGSLTSCHRSSHRYSMKRAQSN